MSKSNSNNIATDLTAITNRLLSAVWGTSVEANPVGVLGGSERSNVQRFLVTGGPADTPSRVVVKQALSDNDANYDPNTGIASWRYFNEWATLQFLTNLSTKDPLCPRFITADRRAGVVIMEDLGEVPQLDHLLLGHDAGAAREGLIALMSTLGRMHGLTMGRQSAFDQLRTELNAWRPKFLSEDPVTAIHQRFAKLSKGVGIKVEAAVTDDIESLRFVYKPDNPFMALVHKDPCPDNALMLNDQIMLIDFEFAEFRHALMDGVYGRVHFPSCWCVNRVPMDVVNAMSVAYRNSLAINCPVAADDRLYTRAETEVSAVQCVISLTPEVFKRDRSWGVSSTRQRAVLRLGLLRQITAEAGHLEALGAAAGNIADACRRLWLDLDEMPLYPAFRS